MCFILSWSWADLTGAAANVRPSSSALRREARVNRVVMIISFVPTLWKIHFGKYTLENTPWKIHVWKIHFGKTRLEKYTLEKTLWKKLFGKIHFGKYTLKFLTIFVVKRRYVTVNITAESWRLYMGGGALPKGENVTSFYRVCQTKGPFRKEVAAALLCSWQTRFFWGRTSDEWLSCSNSLRSSNACCKIESVL